MQLIGSEVENCPPSEAKCEEGEFYRVLSRGNTPDSWLSSFDLKLHPLAGECERKALSIVPKDMWDVFLERNVWVNNKKRALLKIMVEHG